MNITTIIKKPLLVLESGEKFSINPQIVIDKYFRKIRFLIIKNSQDIFFVDTLKIYSYKNDAIIIKKQNYLIPKNIFELKPTHFIVDINSLIFNTSGDFICHITNYKFNQNFKIEEIIYKTKKSELSFISSSSKKTIIVSKKKKYKKQKDFPENKIEYKNILVKNTILKRKTITNTNFLLGRMATKSIFSFSGETIIKKNQIINFNHIEKAKQFYKIRELIYFSKIIN